MHSAIRLFTYLGIVAFLASGTLLIFTDHMADDFLRFGMPDFRRLVGAAEVFGAIGLLFRRRSPVLLAYSATGLSLLMFGGVVIRLWCGDPILQAVPACLLMLAMAMVAFSAVGRKSTVEASGNMSAL